MPNSRSAKKRVAYIERRTARNAAIKSTMKTALRRFDTAIAEGDTDQAKELYGKVSSVIDKAAKKGTIHKNKAARSKSRLAKRLNSMQAVAQ